MARRFEWGNVARRLSAAFVVVLASLAAAGLRAETVVVRADRDTTLIEDPDGALANGAGHAVFVGRTGQSTAAVRRGLLRFDVAAALPPRAIVEAVRLHVTALPGNPGAFPVAIHRLLAAWGEGASFAVGGRGAPSESGDATWIHTFYPSALWEAAGGDFVERSSASLVVDGPAEYVVTGSAPMLADVRLWTAAPSRNFGWILIGDEARPQSVQPFAASENPEAALHPFLEIDYRVAGRRERTAAHLTQR